MESLISLWESKWCDWKAVKDIFLDLFAIAKDKKSFLATMKLRFQDHPDACFHRDLNVGLPVLTTLIHSTNLSTGTHPIITSFPPIVVTLSFQTVVAFTPSS